MIPHFLLQKIRRKSSIYKNSNAMIKEIFCGLIEQFSIGGWAGFWRYWFDWYLKIQNESKQRCDIKKFRLRLENFDGINGWWFEIAGDYPWLSYLSVFMRPQRIICKLSVNVIIHLEAELNYNQISKNTCLPKVSIYILVVLCYKNEQKDILLIAPQYEEI